MRSMSASPSILSSDTSMWSRDDEEVLDCDEMLFEDICAPPRQPSPVPASNPAAGFDPASLAEIIRWSFVSNLGEAISSLATAVHVSTHSPSCGFRNEIGRQIEVKQQLGHMGKGLADLCITPADRAVTVSWLMEVVTACGLQSATLFLAVSYLDRFLAVAQVRGSSLSWADE